VISLPAWHELDTVIEDVLPLTASMRIRVQAADAIAAGDIVEGGIDDMAIIDRGSGNEPPGAPTLVSPPNGAGGQPPAPVLTVANAIDPEGDPLTYSFRVYADPLLTQLVRSADGIAQGSSQTSWTVSPPLAEDTYTWRVFAADPELRGPFMPAASFTVGTTVAVPDAGAPARPGLAGVAPNPFAAATHVSYRLTRPARVRVDLFDATGRHVRRLVDGVAAPGLHAVAWDGRDTRGGVVGPGVYLAQLWVDGAVETQKVVRVR
jgi:hypothetical protein